METLLLWRAKKILIEWNEKTGFNADKYKQDCDLIERNFLNVFLTKDGTLRAATEYCNQTDVWAMCYAISIDFPLPDEIKLSLSQWLVENYDDITESGQLRHLAPGDYWEKTFVPVGKGTYQNGGFWATPVKWFCDALRLTAPELATKALGDVLAYFEKYGIYECVNGEYKQLDTYVASATAVYGACKKDNDFKALVM
jgi:hypothetical protein